MACENGKQGNNKTTIFQLTTLGFVDENIHFILDTQNREINNCQFDSVLTRFNMATSRFFTDNITEIKQNKPTQLSLIIKLKESFSTNTSSYYIILLPFNMARESFYLIELRCCSFYLTYVRNSILHMQTDSPESEPVFLKRDWGKHLKPYFPIVSSLVGDNLCAQGMYGSKCKLSV